MEEDKEYLGPEKKINKERDVSFYEKSEAYRRLLTFIAHTNKVIRGTSNETKVTDMHDSLKQLINVLLELKTKVGGFVSNSERNSSSNNSFKSWGEEMIKVIHLIIFPNIFLNFYSHIFVGFTENA